MNSKVLMIKRCRTSEEEIVTLWSETNSVHHIIEHSKIYKNVTNFLTFFLYFLTGLLTHLKNI